MACVYILKSAGRLPASGSTMRASNREEKTDISDAMLQKNRTAITTNLDIDFLRTLVSAEDLGGMNRAAEHVGRSQSAVSQQMRKLEQKLGHRLFRKQGRGLELTEAGELLLNYARRMLALNDEAVRHCKVRTLKARCDLVCRATRGDLASGSARPIQARASLDPHRGQCRSQFRSARQAQ